MKTKQLLLTLPILLGLSGCSSNDSIAGTYSFQLGAQDSTHVGIHLHLTEDDETVAGAPEGAKKYSMVFDVGGDIFGPLGELAPEDGDDESINISGYYTISDKNDGTRKLNLGITLLESFDIPSDLVDKILYATITDGEINVFIPVSIEDLQYQLYWYGWRITSILDIIAPTDLTKEAPELMTKHNEVGTHPDADFIARAKAYQEKRKAEHPDEDVFLNYRDFYTLNAGFTK